MPLSSFINSQSREVRHDASTQRYERKFVSSILPKTNVEQIVKLNPGFFNEIFKERFINNIYLDTPDYTYYFDNIAGKTNRKKVRVRWYGDLEGEIKNPVLEFKIKNGLTGDKISFELEPFILDKNFNLEKLHLVFAKSKLPGWAMIELAPLVPSLLNRYYRKYFLSVDKLFRLTLDSGLQYGYIGTNNNSLLWFKTDEKNIVVELKYFPIHDDQACIIANHFPFRLSRNSKYVNGIQAFRNHIGD